MTVWDRELALQKLTRYLRENVRDTGSVRSILVDNSSFSMFWCALSVTEPFPMSPVQANFTPSFVASIATVKSKTTSQYVIGHKTHGTGPSYPTPITDSNHGISSGTLQMVV